MIINKTISQILVLLNLVGQMRIVDVLLVLLLWIDFRISNFAIFLFSSAGIPRYLRIDRLIKQAVDTIVHKLSFSLRTMPSIIHIIVANMIIIRGLFKGLMLIVSLKKDRKIYFFLNRSLERLNIWLRLKLDLFHSDLLLRNWLILKLLSLYSGGLYLPHFTISWFGKICRWRCGTADQWYVILILLRELRYFLEAMLLHRHLL